MLSSVLNSKAAIQVNMSIMRAFVAIRQLIANPPVDRVGELEKQMKDYMAEVFAEYKDINDKTVKHNDKIDARLLEFLLYQTGLLIRMVLRVSGQIEGN